MKKIAFLTTNSLEGFVSDDELAKEPLGNMGWNVEDISWRREDVDWENYSGVIIRSTWDYHKDLPVFLEVLEQIEKRVRLANSVSMVRWNANKTYLQDLKNAGLPTIPTIWSGPPAEKHEIANWFGQLEAEEIIVKPAISASADGTLRLHRDDLKDEKTSISELAGGQLLVQPFIKAIVEEGEWSLFYFGGEYSHAILKTPKAQDFRVQEEHGGYIQAVEPPAKLLEAGVRAMRLLGEPPLYARVDLVRYQNDFALMEFELIEPALYLRMDKQAPVRFAKAVGAWLKS